MTGIVFLECFISVNSKKNLTTAIFFLSLLNALLSSRQTNSAIIVLVYLLSSKKKTEWGKIGCLKTNFHLVRQNNSLFYVIYFMKKKSYSFTKKIFQLEEYRCQECFMVRRESLKDSKIFHVNWFYLKNITAIIFIQKRLVVRRPIGQS